MLQKTIVMKTSTKILIILYLVVTIPAVIMSTYLFASIKPTQTGFVFNFNVYGYVALGLIAGSNILGSILYFRFISSLKLSKALFFSVFPTTVLYACALYSLAIVGRYTTPLATSVKLSLNISQNNNYNSILWAVLLTGAYLIVLLFIFVFACKPLQRVERIAYRLGDGRVREGSFKIGGIEQFKKIENSLEKINYNYREKENLVKKADIEAQKFIPREFINFLGKKNISSLELGLEVEKRATTLSCEFLSPNSGEALSLKDNFSYVNSYLTLIAPIVRKHNGFVDKYFGEGILAVFGKAEEAIVCAHSIFHEIEKKNLSQKHLPSLKTIISVNTGDVVFGVVGEENRKSPTIVSPVVTLASKMQEINKFLSTSIIFTKQSLSEMSTKYSFGYRYIGSVSENGACMALFESLEVYGKDKKDKLLKTKIAFENGVRSYNDRDYDEAKGFFAEVLKIVPDDKASYIYYNKSCEKSV